jgi:hypothetical protein
MTSNTAEKINSQIEAIMDTYPDLSPDKAFLVWFIDASILNPDIENSEEKAKKAVMGGNSGDKSADAVLIDDEAKCVFIIQGKYHTSKNKQYEKRQDLIALAHIGRTILSLNNREFHNSIAKCNEYAKINYEKARKYIIERGYRLHLQYVTTGQISNDHKQDAERIIDEFENTFFETWAHEDILILWDDYINSTRPVPTTDLHIEGEQLFKFYDTATKRNSWIFSVSGQQIGHLYNEFGNRIFSRNIRGFKGENTVNRDIASTLKDLPEDFWYFNNGITIVCDAAKHVNEKGLNFIRIKNAQIINGQQTTRVLASHEGNHAKILVKLIEISRLADQGNQHYFKMVNHIVKATNWQNAISQVDLMSNDAEQIRLEREMRKYGYQYLRKDMSAQEATRLNNGRYSWKIKKEDLAKSIGACILDPRLIRRGKKGLFEEDVYRKIFNGQSISMYLLFNWLDKMVSWLSRKDPNRAYARWLVLNYMWSILENNLKQPLLREQFRITCERANQKKHHNIVLPLYYISDTIYIAAMNFYKTYTKTPRIKKRDISTFFDQSNLHFDFQKFINKQPPKFKLLLEKRKELFLKRLKKEVSR